MRQSTLIFPRQCFCCSFLSFVRSVLLSEVQANTQRGYNVVTTSLQRHDVAATLMRCCVFAGFVLCHRVILPIPSVLEGSFRTFAVSCIYFCVHLCPIFCLNEAGEATSFWSLLSHFESHLSCLLAPLIHGNTRIHVRKCTFRYLRLRKIQVRTFTGSIYITKTCLFKYIENFTVKKGKKFR